MSAGACLAGLCLLGLAAVRQPWQFYVLWGLGIGLAMGLTINEVPFTAITNWFVRRRGTALAIYAGVGGLALPLFVPAAGWMVAHLGWRPALAVMSLSLLLVMLPLCAGLLRRRPEDIGLLPDGQPDAAPGSGEQPAGIAFAAALRGVTFWMLTVATALANLGFGLVGIHQVAFLIGRGYGLVLAAAVVGAVGLVSLPARVVFSLATDFLSAQRVLAIAITAEGCGIALLVLARSAAWLLLYVLVFGLAFGSIGPLRAATVAQRFGRRAFGAIVTAAAFPTYVAIAAGSFVSGWLFDRLGSYDAVFWAAVVSCAVAVMILLLMPGPASSQPRT